MQEITWFAPILPGHLESWKVFTHAMASHRAVEFDESRKRMGMIREVASLLQTPAGDFVCLYHEADDLARAFHIMATSPAPFDVWFRESVAAYHGITSEIIDGQLPARVFFNYERDIATRNLHYTIADTSTDTDTD